MLQGVPTQPESAGHVWLVCFACECAALLWLECLAASSTHTHTHTLSTSSFQAVPLQVLDAGLERLKDSHLEHDQLPRARAPTQAVRCF